MFERPSRSELSRLRDEQFGEWMDRIRNHDVTIVGSGPAGLTAGIVLQKQGRDVVILDESEQLGGRLFWESGPLPIVSPVDELLEDLGYPVHTDPPIWLDRVEFLDFLLHSFVEEGGAVVPGVYIDSLPEEDRGFEIAVSIQENREVLESEELVLTEPKVNLRDVTDRGDDPMETMVLNTTRVPEGWILAGYQALPENERDEDYPFENAECLSGRKSAELVLTGE